jgi:nucleotide sugar dehydrogenase
MSEFSTQEGTVAVVGLGKIGLPLAIQYVRQGCRVIGCDINPQVVEGINAGQNHVHEEPGLDDAVAEAVARGRRRATTETAAATREAQVVVVIVPVVVDAEHHTDYRALDSATRAVGQGLTAGTLVVFETTLPVGTTGGHLRTLLEETSGLRAGRDFLLAFSPERVSSGVIFRDLHIYPKVVGGIDAASTEAAVAFYTSVLEAGTQIIQMASADDAEFVKLIETTYRDVNIALANEYARFADARGLDVAAAIAAANTQPYSHIHQPGVGVGGHCIPVYPYFLLQGGGEGELTLPRRARARNDGMATYAVERIEAELGPVAGRGVLILGVAYRGDVREAAFTTARLLREALAARGARVYAHDPLFDDAELERLGYTPVSAAPAADIQALVVQAAHSAYATFDFAQFPECRVVLDGRRALSPEQLAELAARGVRCLWVGDGRRASAYAR